MESIQTAQDIGKRCRRFRNAIGMSQQALADLVNTTAQNIHKYEKQGLSNVEMIQSISKALGHNLLEDEADAEGTIGEIGKEILLQLAHNKGNVDAEYLLSGESLFGLSSDRVIHEVLKLEKLGLCVREQYEHYNGREQDEVFITAKGIIALKNLNISLVEYPNLNEVETYEMKCEEYSSIQEVMDSKPELKIAYSLDYSQGYKINLISYIKKYYFDHDGMQFDEIITGEGCHFDIFYGMVTETSREDLDFYFKNMFMGPDGPNDDTVMDKVAQLEYELGYWNDSENGFLSRLDSYVDEETLSKITDAYAKYNDYQKQDMPSLEVTQKKREELEIAKQEMSEFIDVSNTSFEKSYEDKRAQYDTPCPLYWYSEEEIKKYCKDNFIPASNEKELEIDATIARLAKVDKQLIASYFRFPEEWHENGLADYIMDLFGVTEICREYEEAEKGYIESLIREAEDSE